MMWFLVVSLLASVNGRCRQWASEEAGKARAQSCSGDCCGASAGVGIVAPGDDTEEASRWVVEEKLACKANVARKLDEEMKKRPREGTVDSELGLSRNEYKSDEESEK